MTIHNQQQRATQCRGGGSLVGRCTAYSSAAGQKAQTDRARGAFRLPHVNRKGPRKSAARTAGRCSTLFTRAGLSGSAHFLILIARPGDLLRSHALARRRQGGPFPSRRTRSVATHLRRALPGTSAHTFFRLGHNVSQRFRPMPHNQLPFVDRGSNEKEHSEPRGQGIGYRRQNGAA